MKAHAQGFYFFKIEYNSAAQYIRKNPSEVCPAKWKEGEETLTPGLDLVGKI